MFWLSFIYLVIRAVAAVQVAVLQNHFPVLLLRQNNPFPKKIVCFPQKLFEKFGSEQPFFFKKNFASLRRCQGTLSRQMTFLSSVIFVYCLRSIEDNCTVPRVYCQTTLDKSQVYRTVFLGIAVATAVVWLPLSRPARSSFARRGKHLGEFRSGNTWGNLEVA